MWLGSQEREAGADVVGGLSGLTLGGRPMGPHDVIKINMQHSHATETDTKRSWHQVR